jgi:hypothetical protein
MAAITAAKNMVQVPCPRPVGKRTRELLKNVFIVKGFQKLKLIARS